MRLVVITGPSGAGKTLALHSLEDAGFYAVDNLPPQLLPALAEFCRRDCQVNGAVVIDTRSGPSFATLPGVLEKVKASGYKVEVLYLDASDTTLLQRYKETRRPHPLRRTSAADKKGEGGIMEVIQEERSLLDAARAAADQVIDTSSFSPHQFRETIQTTYAENSRPGLLITVVSFGFKHGLPVDADLVFDVRFLVNPHYVPDLRGLDGRNSEVAEYVNRDPNAAPFQQKMRELVLFCLPEYVREGKAYLNIAIGCTGGQHRSVVLAVALAESLESEGYSVTLRHRDIDASKRSEPE